jgi:4-amino-4-deoxychorismate lyase
VDSKWSVNGGRSCIDPADRGLAYGDGLFETMAANEGAIRWLDYHLERLVDGCARLEIPLPDRGRIERWIARDLPRGSRAIVKLIVTRGGGARGYSPPLHPEPNVIIGISSWSDPPASHYTEGLVLATCGLRLGENPRLAGLKHLNRLEQVLAQLELRGRGVDEGLLLSAGNKVVSGTSNNVFAVHEGAVRTPRLDTCGVRGVMRRLAIEFCRAHAIRVDEVDIEPDELLRADELFVTNALHGVRPVRALDATAFELGAVTRAIASGLGSMR